MEMYLHDEEEMEKRVYIFPNAALKENENKINYFEYISNLKNEDCNSALERIFHKIDMETINEIIDQTPYISDIRKSFYKEILRQRYEKILEYSFHKLYLTKKNEN